MASDFFCYLIVSGARTYIGATTNIPRRVRQHNGELAGGARATQRGRPWRLRAACVGLASWREALSFEWHWKHRHSRRGVCRGLDARLQRACKLCAETPFRHVRFLSASADVATHDFWSAALGPSTNDPGKLTQASLPEDHKEEQQEYHESHGPDDDEDEIVVLRFASEIAGI